MMSDSTTTTPKSPLGETAVTMPPIPTGDCSSTISVLSGRCDPTTLGLCFHHLLEAAIVSHEQKTDKLALICGDDSISYHELNKRANHIAGDLIRRGASYGDVIGVALSRSVNLVVVLIAIWKAGATYVPIDPALPTERVAQMLEDCSPRLLITETDANIGDSALPAQCERISLEDVLRYSRNMDHDNPSVQVIGSDLAYIMYTSGSTGRPKGVEVTHGSIVNLLLSLKQEPGCGPDDRLLAITTISFDMAVVELFLPLICGATIIIAQKGEVRDTRALVELMERHEVTIMQGTPAIWQMLVASGWQGQPRRLKQIWCGGEALSKQLAEALLPQCTEQMWNLYGPTEATVYGSIWQIPLPVPDVICIGHPLTNGGLYVLDEDLGMIPRGSPGDLYIAGAGVARGYRNRGELSRAVFVDDAFHPGTIMYRTGDLARIADDGEVVCLGRKDGQVKIRGHRIELGDVEAALSAHKDVSSAVAICRDDRLVAYYTAYERQTTDVRVLRLWMAARLPSYMVPAFFVEMQAFPVTMNGKIDRRALPDPVPAVQTPPKTPPGGMTATGLENEILKIWSKVLGHNSIDVDDNFFEVGGDSVRLVRIHAELESVLRRRIAITKLFEHFTPRTIAAWLSDVAPRSMDRQAPRSAVSVEENHDIAIVSMACRLPGGIDGPESFWEVLNNGIDATSEVPDDRWDRLHDTNVCRRGGFLPADWTHSFDLSLFGVSPREAQRMDPAQYTMLETTFEAFERAGYTMSELRGSQTGVFIGTSNILSHQALGKSTSTNPVDLDGYTTTGSAGGTMSGRIAYQLGLEGPVMTIDTACSSSLVTTHLACNTLRNGECDVAVSGGISLLSNPGLHIEFGRLGGMSTDGRCRPFSADADGTAWAEGSVAVVLKRLADARRDGDEIHAIIRGSAVNHDGRSATLTTPSVQAQQKLVRKALDVAGLRPDDIGYVEAHGTGTKLGDPIEAAALAGVFGGRGASKEPLSIGSAKSNIGHTQAAAGLVGLVKVALALRHGSMPRTLHVTEPTPAVDWEAANMLPVMKKRAWQSREGGESRRATISAFGIGGTNASVVVEEAPRHVVACGADEVDPVASSVASLEAGQSPQPARDHRNDIPFLLSAESDAALQAQAAKLYKYLESGKHSIQDVGFSLATTRTHFRRRAAVLAANQDELLEKLRLISTTGPSASDAVSASTAAPNLAMLFTGQGSQWPGMAKGLYDAYPVFRNTLDDITTAFDAEMHPGEPLLRVLLEADDSAGRIQQTSVAQPALFALAVSLFRLCQSWGVFPDMVLGHSLGELVAAHVAGIFSLADAIRLVAARGRLMQAQAAEGLCMVSVEASLEEVQGAIEGSQPGFAEVDIALSNTPTQTVLSGTVDAVQALAASFEARGRRTKTIVTGHAFHSRRMDGMLTQYRSVVDTVRFGAPQIPIISSVMGRVAEPGELQDAGYWVEQARASVLWRDAMSAALIQNASIFLELGPGSVLCGMGAACVAAAEGNISHPLAAETGSTVPPLWLPSISKALDSSVIERSLAHLHVRHVNVDWKAYYQHLKCRRVDLPTYAFQRDFHLEYKSKPTGDTGIGLAKRTGTSADHRQTLVKASQFEMKWQPVEAPLENLKGSSLVWGLYVLPATSKSKDCSTWAEQVSSTLRQTLARHNTHLIQVDNPGKAKDMSRLLCICNFGGAEVIAQTRDGVPEALALLQSAVHAQFPVPMIWITRHSIGTGIKSDDATISMGAGPGLCGLLRSARNEHPELCLRLVDLSQDIASLDPLAVMSSLTLDSEPECAVRRDQVLVPRMLRVTGPSSRAPPDTPLLRTDGAVLITGGLGSLGILVARWLIREHGVRDIVLTSLRGMQAPGADALVAELSAAGVRVSVEAGDIANPTTVNSIMTHFSSTRPLRGVIHAAGVVASSVLSTMTAAQCEATLAPKAYGAWLLHEATKDMDLDMFFMFSSISGVMGMSGLANYAAANTFLDSLAHKRRAMGLPATSVAYGTWGGDGMAARLQQSTRAHLEQFGLELLNPDDGLAILRDAVSSQRALAVGAAIDLGRLKRFYEEHEGKIPAYLQALLGTVSIPKILNSTHNKVDSLIEVLATTASENHPAILMKTVKDVIAKALAIPPAQTEAMDVDRSLQDMGVDSLTTVQIRNHLQTLSQLTLPVNVALLHPNIRALANFLLGQLRESKSTVKCPASSPGARHAEALNVSAMLRGCLEPSITFNASKDDNKDSSRPSHALITGATGFVGAHILATLLERSIPTTCIVRAADRSGAFSRIIDTLESYSLWSPKFLGLLTAVPGDIASANLGLTREAHNALAGKVTTIIHAAGRVDWMLPLDVYVGPNTVSTHELLRLASSSRPAPSFHLVSTISTLPLNMGHKLTDADAEYGYATSKFAAERLLAAARWRGARGAAYRLPYVTASGKTGHFRQDKGDFLHNLVSGSIEMGALPIVRDEDVDMGSVLPVDYLADKIMSCVLRDETSGKPSKDYVDYDFLNPHAPSCRDFFEMVAQRAGGACETMMFGEWKAKAKEYADRNPKSALARIWPVLDGCTDESATALFKTGFAVGGNVIGREEGEKTLMESLLGDEFVVKYLERFGGRSSRAENPTVEEIQGWSQHVPHAA